ncbi:MAG: histidine phosphotransferase family protein [Pseudomonadota bacterium]
MEKPDIHVIEHLVSRICHDLISPVGAIQNGLELLDDMGPEGFEDARDLLNHSASQAAGRLKTFRMAFGAGGRDPNIGMSDVYKNFADYLPEGGRLQQRWDPMDVSMTVGDMPPGAPKLALCALLIAAECLPKGGIVGIIAADDRTLHIQADGPTLMVPDTLQQAMRGTLPADAHDAKLITALITALSAQSLDIRLELQPEKPDALLVMHLPR